MKLVLTILIITSVIQAYNKEEIKTTTLGVCIDTISSYYDINITENEDKIFLNILFICDKLVGDEND